MLTPVTASSDRVVVGVSDGRNTATANVDIALRFDPLLPNQRNLRRSRQAGFADDLSFAGVDINVAPAWALGYSGAGVKVGVVDSGLEIAHEDLSANVNASSSIDFRNNGNDPSPTAGYDHGTMVSGIIAAVGFNGRGGRGVAYRSTLRGYNFLVSQSQDNFAKSFGQDDRSRDNDIFNGSFGAGAVTGQSLPPSNNTKISVLNAARSLRGGKGAVVVMSAGNAFQSNAGESSNPASTCGNVLTRIPVSCGSPAADDYKQSVVPIIVGALGADGKKASYSNTASSIWVSAPAGEGGNEAAIRAGLDALSYKPATVTTTTTGCAKYTQSWNTLDSRGLNPLSLQCQYTATMNGTSAAAPVVSGVAALMLEANPNLGYRDVAHILASTARKVDPDFAGVQATAAGALRSLEYGWVTNAAGYRFSNRYGFGAVDAGEAVSMAKSYSNYLPTQQTVTAAPFQAVGDVSIGSNGKFVAFQVSTTVTKTEKAFVLANLFMRDLGAYGTYCLQIELTSPAGTRSVLLNAANGFKNSIIDSVLLSSNAFYGENPNGEWRMTVYDWCDASALSPTQFSLTKPQEFGLTGH